MCAVRYTNGEEMWVTKSEESSFRGSLLAHEIPEWQDVKNTIAPAFTYIDNRLTDQCDDPYHMRL